MIVAYIRHKHLFPAIAISSYIPIVIKLMVACNHQDLTIVSEAHFQNLRCGMVESTRYPTSPAMTMRSTFSMNS